VSFEKTSITTAVFEQTPAYFIQLRDEEGDPADFHSARLQLRDRHARELDFKLERARAGDYYLIVDEKLSPSQFPLSLWYENTAFLEKLENAGLKADARRSKIKILAQHPQSMLLQLSLKDSEGNIIPSRRPPEIILQGEARLAEMHEMGPGIWQFSVIYPDDNEIIYISVRTQNAHLERIFRFQYIAK
jgi:hypothetical protein